MTSNDPVPGTGAAAPRIFDVVRARRQEPHRQHPGVVIDVFPQPRISNGDYYRVEFQGGITEWFWRDELTVIPWTAERNTVRIDLAAIRTILHHAIVVADGHDVLYTKLGELFDTVTATASAYLGGSLDTLIPTASAD
jgi:hypothetical protein